MNKEKILRCWRLLAALFLLVPHVSLQCQEGPSSVPLIEAMRQGNLREARRILRSSAKLNVLDNYGDTPLQQAIRGGYTVFAKELLSAGSDPKFTDAGGGTSLMVAAWNNDLSIAAELRDRGVPVNAANSSGETALILASQTCLDAKMVRLLLDAGADPKSKTDIGVTAIMSAAHTGNVLAAEELLKAGADPTVKDNYGETAEDMACGRGEKGHTQVCALLREALKTK